MKKVLVVIDMQNDFITGSLGSAEAQAIVPNVVRKIGSQKWDTIITTYDTHYSDDSENYSYENTLEGEKLPVEHCIRETEGWRLEETIHQALVDCKKLHLDTELKYLTKPTFGSRYLPEYLRDVTASAVACYKLRSCDDEVYNIDVEVEICGLCTDICVISNALLLRAAFPNMKITCDSSCCAGVTPEKHAAALEVMRSCQIDVI